MAIASEGGSADGCRKVAEEMGVVRFRLLNQLFVSKALHYLGDRQEVCNQGTHPTALPLKQDCISGCLDTVPALDE
jgi:hypothetical protein